MKSVPGLFLLCCLATLAACAPVPRSAPPEGLRVAAVVLSTPDPARLARWYAEVLGFEPGVQTSGVTGVGLNTLRRGDLTLVLATVPNQEPLSRPKNPPLHLETPGLRNLVFWVDDLAEANARLEARQIALPVKNIILPSLGVLTTSFHDPDGNLVALWQRMPSGNVPR